MNKKRSEDEKGKQVGVANEKGFEVTVEAAKIFEPRQTARLEKRRTEYHEIMSDPKLPIAR